MSLGIGCGSSEKRDGGGEPKSEGGSSGGTVTTGGRPASGGSASDSGGAPSTGGGNSTGGRNATGGSEATGGDATGGRAPSGGAAGEGVGGSLGGGGDGGSAPDVGQCREVARYRFSTGDNSLSGYYFARIPGGFLLSPDPGSSAPIIIADETGKSREIPRELADQNPSVMVGDWFAVGTASDPRFMNIRRLDDPDVNRVYVGYFFVQSFLESGAAVGEERSVLEIFMRGTAMNYYARSSDGERVALANVEPVIRDPRLVLVSKDGEPIGDEVRVLDTGDSPLISCFEVRGTLHGAVAVAADRGLVQMRIVEIGATGELVQEYTLQDSTCPYTWADPSGVYLSFPGFAGDVYRLADGELVKVFQLPESTQRDYYSWLVGGEQPLILHQTDDEVSFARLKGGKLVPLSGSFSGDLMPSPLDGRTFLLTYEDYAVGVVEVACGLAE